MTIELPPRDLRQYLLDDLAEIESAIEGYTAGRLSAYQTIAIQLRTMLTDARPLLRRVVPGATFQRLRAPHTTSASGFVAYYVDFRGLFTIGTGSPIVQVEVTEDLVDVDEWLDDWIVQPGIKIRDLIREVGSKDVAHMDDNPGRAMSVLETNLILGVGGRRVEMVRPVIVGIGQYVARRVHTLLEAE